jgi:hypothetical protein
MGSAVPHEPAARAEHDERSEEVDGALEEKPKRVYLGESFSFV